MELIDSEILKRFPPEKRNKLLLCLISSFIFGLAAHAYGLMNNIFSHDSLNALYADSTENLAKISVGRFLVPVLRTIRGPVALPWVIGIIAIFLIGLSVYLVVKIFDVKSNVATIIISGFMVTNVTVTALTATYVHELDLDMFALFLSCLAAYYWKKSEKITGLIPACILSVISMAIYQSYAEVTVTIIIMVLILQLLDNGDVKKVFFKGVGGAACIGLAAAIYFALNKLFIILFKTEALERVDLTSEYEDSIITRFINLFKIIFTAFISPSTVLSTVVIAGINLLILAGVVFFVIYIWKKNKVSVSGKLLTALLAAMLPIAINFVCLLNHEGVHDVMIYSFCLIHVFAVVILFKYTSFIEKIKLKKLVSVVSLLMVAVLVWNNILVSNTAYLKKDMVHDVTITTFNRVIEDLEARDDYVVGETEVAFSGYPAIHTMYPGFDKISRMTGMQFTIASGALLYTSYFNAYDNLFKYFLNYPIVINNTDYHNDSRVEAMPSFPEDGYIQNIDGLLVVKLGGIEIPSAGDSNIKKDLDKLIDLFS